MAASKKPRLGFIGPGTVGTALAHGLAAAGYHVDLLYGRDASRLRHALSHIPTARVASTPQQVVDEADLVFLTVPDDSVADVAGALTWNTGKSAVHCSGACSLELLASAETQGASVGAFHPLQSFAGLEQALKNLPGSAFAIEASDTALEETLDSIARDLGGRPFVVTGEKALYHASAVIACNFLVTLLDASSSLWEAFGLAGDQGLKALLPLVRGTIENVETIGLPDALTGPIARGDVGTVDRHLAALRRSAPELVDLYCALARRTIPIGRAKGTLSRETATRLLEHLNVLGQESPDDTETR